MNPLYKKLIEIDRGRFKKLVETFDIKDVCFNCSIFNAKAEDGYRCGCAPCCIGATLDAGLKSYLLYKIDVITEEEHHRNLAP